MKRLSRDFYGRSALIVARKILGKYIVRRFRGKKIVGKIVEVEAYYGPKDRASHAYGGKRTKRNRAEYYVGGHIYIYLVYGMYWQCNISTGPVEHPECILIRAVEPVQGFGDKEASGPGKFCKAFHLNKSFYGEDLTNSKQLWLEDNPEKVKIKRGPRIGIDYAGPYWAKVPWRFYIKGNAFVSRS